MSEQLLIIGNGFDMVHDLETTYSNFHDNYMSRSLKHKWHSYLKNANIKDEWNSFENQIGQLTVGGWFNTYIESYHNENFDENDSLRESLLLIIDDINDMFNKLTMEFFDFIKTQMNILVYPIDNLMKNINQDAQTISFNYTKTSTLYVDNTQYIHGSVEEGTIIFGYKMRPEFNGIMSEAVKYSKQRLRDVLQFRRAIQDLVPDDKIDGYIEVFLKYLSRSYTGRGLWFDYSPDSRKLLTALNIYNDFPSFNQINEDVYNTLKKERINEIPPIIDEYLENFSVKQEELPININFKKVTHLVILGHSLEADKEVFDSIFKRLINLDKIGIYSYDQESQDSIDKKKIFFDIYGSFDIQILNYK